MINFFAGAVTRRSARAEEGFGRIEASISGAKRIVDVVVVVVVVVVVAIGGEKSFVAPMIRVVPMRG